MSGCPVETEIQEHRFVCILEAGHDDRDHFWWLAAPVNTWLELPDRWTADLLVEDDWENA